MEWQHGKTGRFYETRAAAAVRLKYLQYFFSFPLAMIFATSQHYLLQGRADVFGLKFITIGVIAFGAGATVFFTVAGADNISKLSKIASVLALVGLIPYFALPEGVVSSVCAVILMAGIGGCVSLSSYSSGFILNNAERFLGGVLILVITALFRIANELLHAYAFFMPAVMGIIALGLIVSSFLCKAGDFKLNLSGRGGYNASIWLILLLFLSFFLTKSLGIHIPEFHMPGSDITKGTSVIAAAGLCLVLHFLLERGIWTICNIFFIAVIGCYVLSMLGYHTLTDASYGLKEVGLLVSIYMIGCYTNRFSNFKMHKRILFLMMPVIIPIYIIPDILSGTGLLLPVAIGISSALFLTFLLLTPLFSKHLFSTGWAEVLPDAEDSVESSVVKSVDVSVNAVDKSAKVSVDAVDKSAKVSVDANVEAYVSAPADTSVDTSAPDYMALHTAAHINRRSTDYDHRFDNLGLTSREKETAFYLLQGCSAKQVASELGIKLDTVRYHTKNLYKKLGIGSKAELFARFGVDM